jgi:hypothetical protein
MVRLKTLVTPLLGGGFRQSGGISDGIDILSLISSAFRVEAMSKLPKQTAITQPLMHDDLREDYRASSIQAVGNPISLPPIRHLC